MTDKEEKEIMFEQALDKGLKSFWKKYGRTLFVKARHTDLMVQPKMIVGGEVNPEVMKRLVEAYLAKLTPAQLMNKEVEFSGDAIIIKDKEGKRIAEVTSKRIINNMRNVITKRIGALLTELARDAKEPYVQPKEDGRYSFGDIKEGVSLFLAEQGKKITGNILIDALLLLEKSKRAPEEVSFSMN